MNPLTENHKCSGHKALTDTWEDDVATSVANIISKSPDLVRLIQEWPEMAESTKRVILAAIKG